MRRPAKATAAAAVILSGVLVAQSGGQTAGPYVLPQPTPAPAMAPEAPPEPRLGRMFVIERVRGRVRFRRPGEQRSSRLTGAVAVPAHTAVDARRGRVRVIAARDRDGRRWRAVFFAGRFEISQPRRRSARVTLALAGGDFSACEPEATTARASRRARKRRRVRRLWGDGKGRFRTRGRYSAATVRGTRWLVEDRCGGTLTRVARGEVVVEDFADPPPPAADPAPPPAGAPAPQGGQDESASGRRRARRVRVKQGESYVAGPRP